jgi:hypothetical protein
MVHHSNPPEARSAAVHDRVMAMILHRGIHSSCSARAGEERASREAG